MTILARIIEELSVPDDQGRDWYGWSSNQLSHAFLGVVVALFYASAPLVAAALAALTKEAVDLLRGRTWRTARDSAWDVAFWMLGAWVATADDYLTTAVILTSFALICGVIPRARKAMIGG